MKELNNYIKESLLSDINDTIDRGVDDVKKITTFGYKFKFSRAIVGSLSGGVLNMVSLKKLTSGMDYISDNIERGQFDKQNKIKMFANLLDHLSFDDLNIDPNMQLNDEFRKLFTEKFNDYCKKHNIFNSYDRVCMWAVSEAASGKDRMDIIVSRIDKINNAYTFKLFYKIDKI